MSSPTSLPLPFVHPDQIEEEAKITQIEFYKTKPIKLVAYYILSVLTIGVVPLLCLLKPKVRVFFKCTEASTSDAQYVIAVNIDGIFEHKTLISREFFFSGQRKFCKSFMFRYYTYYFDEEDGLYKPCQFSLEGKTYNSIHKEMGTGMPSMMTIEQRLITYGPNTTDIPMKSNWSIFFKEILTPYYLFQLYTIVIWGYYSDYPIYAGISLAASLILLIAHCFEAKNIMTKICQQAHYETETRVYRPSEDEEERNSQVPGLINSAYLVPGDLIEISHGKKLPCDVILLSGTCVMNENMLTGESTLLNKTPLPRSEKVFNYWTAKKHILFAGTECVETIKTELEPQIVGVVIRTGFLTMKGRIIRSFLCAKKDKSQLYKDSMKYMAIMVLIGLIFVFVGLHVMIQQEEGKFGPIFKRCVGLIIVVVPPILTTFLSLGLLISTLRLKLNNVLTTSELKITLAGRVQMVCFDKTGTLTNNSLDLHGVKGVSRTAKNKLKFEPMIKNNIHASLSCSSEKSSSHLLLEVMATCHNLTSVENTFLGEMLDIKMVEAIGWQIYNQDEHGARVHAMKPPSDLSDDSYYKLTSELSIIKRFPFSPKLQRMTVISKDPREPKQRMNIKGVPEIIRKLCQPKTIPDDFDDILYYYTRNGFKVVACATKLLKDQVRISDNLSREFFEKDLEFLGFLIFENKIRESAPIAIAELSEAEIPTLMMTGDNSTAALLTARLCGIINKNHKIAMATLGSASDGDDSSLNRIKWTWMGSPHKEEMGRVFEPPETHYVLELGDTEHNVLMKGSDTNDMRSFLENLRLDHRAVIVITGDAFKYLEEQLVNEPALFKSLVNKMKIFSQLNSDDKAIVIRELQKQGNVVAMVGNGVSACQALQTADISIAITDSEATLVSSFLNKAPDLRCVPMILREGRAALVTSFQVSKYMALYCLIQVYSVVAISLSWTWFSNPTFLYMDLFIIIPTAFTLLLTKPMDKLSKGKPPGFLVSVPVLVSVIGQTVIQLVACVLTIKILHVQSWYKSPLYFRESVSQSLGFEFGGDVADYDNTVVFLLGNIQFMALVMAFSIGKPFRKPFFQNYLFMVVFLVTCIMSILLILVKIPRLIDLLQLIALEPEHNFKWILLAITAVNAVATFVYEKLFVQKVANFSSKVLEKFKKKAKLSAYEF